MSMIAVEIARAKLAALKASKIPAPEPRFYQRLELSAEEHFQTVKLILMLRAGMRAMHLSVLLPTMSVHLAQLYDYSPEPRSNYPVICPYCGKTVGSNEVKTLFVSCCYDLWELAEMKLPLLSSYELHMMAENAAAASGHRKNTGYFEKLLHLAAGDVMKEIHRHRTAHNGDRT